MFCAGRSSLRGPCVLKALGAAADKGERCRERGKWTSPRGKNRPTEVDSLVLNLDLSGFLPAGIHSTHCKAQYKYLQSHDSRRMRPGATEATEFITILCSVCYATSQDSQETYLGTANLLTSQLQPLTIKMHAAIHWRSQRPELLSTQRERVL